MHRLWWPQLPLLIIFQLLEPSRLNQKAYVEALLSFKSTSVGPQQLPSFAGQSPCIRQEKSVIFTDKLKGTARFSSSHRTRPVCPKSKAIKPSPCASTSTSSHQVAQIPGNSHKSRKTRIGAPIGGNLQFSTPPPPSVSAKPRDPKITAIIIGCLGSVLLVSISLLLVYFCLMRARKSVRKPSETASSVASPVECPRENGPSQVDVPSESQNIRQLSIIELEDATSKFSQGNVIGEGGFGLVYKGLLQDGSIVAIKRRRHDPTQDFVQEVQGIASICHKHLVKLIGFCQERHEQLLVYDYLPNGNVGNHLYDSEGLPVGKLDILQRLSIALGAAKGLEYLHGLTPPRIHMHFRTQNVLVDESFLAKVSDFGVSKLVVENGRAESYSRTDCFHDPELRSSREFSERTDVYSFGVFLMELISGRESLDKTEPGAWKNLVVEAKSMSFLDEFADKTLTERTTDATQCMMELALQCLDTGIKRPTVKMVVIELELILERERGYQGTGLGDGITAVTLGSDLFK